MTPIGEKWTHWTSPKPKAFAVKDLREWKDEAYEFNVFPLKPTCCSPNPQDLRMGLYLSIKVILTVGHNPIRLASLWEGEWWIQRQMLREERWRGETQGGVGGGGSTPFWPGPHALSSDFQPLHTWEATPWCFSTESVALCYSVHRRRTLQTADWVKILHVCKLHVQQNTCIQNIFLKINSQKKKINSPNSTVKKNKY